MTPKRPEERPVPDREFPAEGESGSTDSVPGVILEVESRRLHPPEETLPDPDHERMRRQMGRPVRIGEDGRRL